MAVKCICGATDDLGKSTALEQGDSLSKQGNVTAGGNGNPNKEFTSASEGSLGPARATLLSATIAPHSLLNYGFPRKLYFLGVSKRHKTYLLLSWSEVKGERRVFTYTPHSTFFFEFRVYIIFWHSFDMYVRT